MKALLLAFATLTFLVATFDSEKNESLAVVYQRDVTDFLDPSYPKLA